MLKISKLKFSLKLNSKSNLRFDKHKPNSQISQISSINSLYKFPHNNFTSNSDSKINSDKFKIYTKTGDKGTTSLLGGKRKNKDAEVFDLLGDIDELNSNIGLCVAYTSHTNTPKLKDLNQHLINIQNHLYHISAFIASSGDQKYMKNTKYEDILEKEIDKMEESLPALMNFINPGGSIEASHLHIARSISRKVERRYLSYCSSFSGETDIKVYQKFFNRLSDFFFVASRYVNHVKNVKENIAV